MAKIYAKLNFVLKIDKQLNVLHYRNEFDSNDSGPTSADLKSTRQFRAESFAQINTNTSKRLLACAVGHECQIWNLDSKICVATCKSDDRRIHHLEKIDDKSFKRIFFFIFLLCKLIFYVYFLNKCPKNSTIQKSFR